MQDSDELTSSLIYKLSESRGELKLGALLIFYRIAVLQTFYSRLVREGLLRAILFGSFGTYKRNPF